LQSVLREIASERAVTSRGRHNPRGVKRKMSGFPVRNRSAPLNVLAVPIVRLISI
jgi:hypothetical protein